MREGIASGVTSVRIGKAGRLWVGFTVTTRGVRKVVVEKSRSRAARAVGAEKRRMESAGRELARRFEAYARGKRGAFTGVKVDLAGMSEFGVQVLKCLRGIGFGKMRTYGRVAEEAGRPGAARAVGQVLAKNPIPLVIPCHRVVGRGGKLGGYSMVGGQALKRQLLAHEGLSGPWR